MLAKLAAGSIKVKNWPVKIYLIWQKDDNRIPSPNLLQVSNFKEREPLSYEAWNIKQLLGFTYRNALIS